MKRLISTILTMHVLCSCMFLSCGALQIECSPQYEYAKTVYVNLTISSSGETTVKLMCSANPDVKKVSVLTYLEKKVNGVWRRVDIPAEDNQWVYITDSKSFMKQYNVTILSRGEYRAIAVFTLNASTTETISKSSMATY